MSNKFWNVLFLAALSFEPILGFAAENAPAIKMSQPNAELIQIEYCDQKGCRPLDGETGVYRTLEIRHFIKKIRDVGAAPARVRLLMHAGAFSLALSSVAAGLAQLAPIFHSEALTFGGYAASTSFFFIGIGAFRMATGISTYNAEQPRFDPDHANRLGQILAQPEITIPTSLDDPDLAQLIYDLKLLKSLTPCEVKMSSLNESGL